VASLGDENVGRLDVSMNNACGVGSISNLNRQTEQNFRLDGLSRDPLFQRHAVKKLHGDISTAVLFANVMNRADVGMIEGRSCFGFALETFECLWVVGHIVGKEFESDGAVEPSVLGLVDDTHTADTKFFKDSVVGNRSPQRVEKNLALRRILCRAQWQVNADGRYDQPTESLNQIAS